MRRRSGGGWWEEESGIRTQETGTTKEVGGLRSAPGGGAVTPGRQSSGVSVLHTLLGVNILLPVAGWGLGWALGDRFLWSQFLAWIPSILVVAWLGLWALLILPWAAGRRRRRGARAWVVMLAVLTPALGLHGILVDFRPASRASQASPEPGLCLLHCNLNWPNRAAAPDVLELVRHRPEDIVVLTDPGWLLGHGRGALLQQDGWQVLRIGRYAVLSRLPLLEARTLVKTRTVDVTMLRVDASARRLGVLTLGLFDLPSNPRTPRMRNARELRAMLDELGAPQFDLAVGDFNTTRGSPSLEILLPNTTHAWNQAGRGWSGSFHRRFPLWHIDHVLLRPGLRAVDYRLEDLGVSKHRAQRVEVGRGEGK